MPRMRDTETDAALALIDEILLIQEIDDVESHEHFLLIPRQIEGVRNRRIVKVQDWKCEEFVTTPSLSEVRKPDP